jgi:hypothetical protein
MEHFHSKKSLKEFSDRELLLFILGNQVNLYRQTQYLMEAIKSGKTEPLGLYADTFHEVIGDIDDILKQAEEYLDQQDEEKGFLRF